jgi:hypothetical protein
MYREADAVGKTVACGSGAKASRKQAIDMDEDRTSNPHHHEAVDLTILHGMDYSSCLGTSYRPSSW